MSPLSSLPERPVASSLMVTGDSLFAPVQIALQIGIFGGGFVGELSWPECNRPPSGRRWHTADDLVFFCHAMPDGRLWRPPPRSVPSRR